MTKSFQYLFLFLELIIYHGYCYSQEFSMLTHQIEPFSYVEKGKLKGVTTDIISEMMKITKYTQSIKIYPFARGLQTVQNKYNYAMYPVARRPERENTVKWVGPLISSGVYFYKKKKSKIKPIHLLNIKDYYTIGVHRGNADYSFLKTKGFDNIVTTSTPIHAIQMLIKGRVDLVPMSELSVVKITKKENTNKNAIEKTNVKLYDSELYLVFSKETSNKVISQWQAALQKIKSNGMYEKIYQKYFPK